MRISLDNFQWVEFKQREITIQRENKIALFELVSPQDSALYQIDYKQYCQRLLEKVLILHQKFTVQKYGTAFSLRIFFEIK